MKGFAEWTFEGGLKKKQIAFSRCRREPNPLSIRHIWMYVTEWTIHCQFEWYRDKRAKALLPSQDFILRRFFYSSGKRKRRDYYKILPPCVCSAESVPTECDVVPGILPREPQIDLKFIICKAPRIALLITVFCMSRSPPR